MNCHLQTLELNVVVHLVQLVGTLSPVFAQLLGISISVHQQLQLISSLRRTDTGLLLGVLVGLAAEGEDSHQQQLGSCVTDCKWKWIKVVENLRKYQTDLLVKCFGSLSLVMMTHC